MLTWLFRPQSPAFASGFSVRGVYVSVGESVIFSFFFYIGLETWNEVSTGPTDICGSKLRLLTANSEQRVKRAGCALLIHILHVLG